MQYQNYKKWRSCVKKKQLKTKYDNNNQKSYGYFKTLSSLRIAKGLSRGIVEPTGYYKGDDLTIVAKCKLHYISYDIDNTLSNETKHKCICSYYGICRNRVCVCFTFM